MEGRGSRSLLSIIRSNTLTPFNALIGSLWVIMIAVAPWQDSLFGLVVVFNTLIGTIQEYRSARTLAKLSLLTEAKPTVIRDGQQVQIGLREIVLDDLIEVSTGDQIPVDGELLAATGLEVDEGLITGEADPQPKSASDPVLSGSFVVSGSGVFVVTAVGSHSFAGRLTQQAQQYQETDSELRDSVNRFIKLISLALVPIGLALLFSQLRADQSLPDALRGAIAGVVTMVPEGLVLLTSIAMAVGVLRLASRRALVQELPAVETLARVDVVCVDKTGTLTAPGMALREVVPLDGAEPSPGAVAALAALARAESAPNPTMQAIAAHYPEPVAVQETIPFSSARKWSAGRLDNTWWVLGAPDVLDPDVDTGQWSAVGARVLLLATTQGGPAADKSLPPLEPTALVIIDQELRPDAAATVNYFGQQEVALKVISGDNAVSVGAVAQRAGVPGAAEPVDAQRTDPVAVVESASVFGRVNPDQKQAMITALRQQGHTVAMTGDGVNDVLALKHADLGIAMGSGSPASRAVSQVVLLDNKWSSLPAIVTEGRRVLGNIERVSDVFLTKSMYAMLISLAIALSELPFPFLPRHLTLISALTIGIPGFFLALMPNEERFRPGFFRRVILFAVPSGLIAATTAYLAYFAALQLSTLYEARVNATIALFIVTVTVLGVSARPMNLLRGLLVAAMVAAFLLVLYVPFLANFFALELAFDADGIATLAIGLAGALTVMIVSRFINRWRDAPA